MSNDMFFQPMSFPQPLQRPSGFIVVPALSLIVFFRRNVGWRLCRPFWLFALTFFLVFGPVFPGEGGVLFKVQNIVVTPTALYGVMMLALGIWHFNMHFSRRKRGGSLKHGFHTGDPWLGFLPVPRFVIVVIIEPLTAFYLGWRLHHYWAVPFGTLGLWLMASAIALALFGLKEARYNFRRGVDLDDMDIEASIAADRAYRSAGNPRPEDDVLNAGAGSHGKHRRRAR
jgi:hypothetical protein